MSHVTQIIFGVLDFTKIPLINRLVLKIAGVYISINDDYPTAVIHNFPKNTDDFYVEKVELYSNENLKRYFRLRIYKNQVNFHSIFVNKLNNFSFEIGYFNKNTEKIPKTLSIKIENKNYDLKSICKTDLPFINSFGIINCDKTILINDKREIFLDEEKKGSFSVIFIASKDNYNMNIIKIHKSYYPKLIEHNRLNKELKTTIKVVKDKLDENMISKSEFSQFLTRICIIGGKYYLEDYQYYIENKLYPLDDIDYELLLNYSIYLIIMKVNKQTESYPILKWFFNLLSLLEEKMKNNIINKRDILSFALYFYEHYCSNEQYKDCLEQKIDSYKELYDNYENNWLDFEFVFIKECNKESAYHKAIKLLEDVLLNLRHNSKLLEILYLLDSGSGKNKQFDNTKTSFNLSMISLCNIIAHIKILIPNMILRKPKSLKKKYDPYAECDINSGIMTIYEETLFKKKLSESKKFLIDNPDINDNYSISIFISLLHEICSHLKLLIKDKDINSPNIINDPYDNYNELSLKVAESGRIMEYYISKDINKIKFLKFSFSPKKDLYDRDLWTDENFEKLNLLIENLMINVPENEIGYLKNEIAFFPEKTDKEIDNIKNDENDDEIDWEFSSPRKSDGEENYKNKSAINNYDSKNDDELENSFEYDEIKPIVKY